MGGVVGVPEYVVLVAGDGVGGQEDGAVRGVRKGVARGHVGMLGAGDRPIVEGVGLAHGYLDPVVGGGGVDGGQDVGNVEGLDA